MLENQHAYLIHGHLKLAVLRVALVIRRGNRHEPYPLAAKL